MEGLTGEEPPEGLASHEVIELSVMPPDSGREVADDEREAFIDELTILMSAVDELMERGKVVLSIDVSFRGEGEDKAADNLGF